MANQKPKPDPSSLFGGPVERSEPAYAELFTDSSFGGPGTPQNDDAAYLLEIAKRKRVAATEKLEADALKARIELEQAARLLVDAEAMEDCFASMVADARDMALNLPAAIKAEYPDVDPALLEFVSRQIMDMLTKLGSIPARASIEVPNRIMGNNEQDHSPIR